MRRHSIQRSVRDSAFAWCSGNAFLAAATPHAAQFAAHDIAISGLGKQVEAFEAVVAEAVTRRDKLAQTRGRLKRR